MYLTVDIITRLTYLYYSSCIDGDADNVLIRVFDSKFAPKIKPKMKHERYIDVNILSAAKMFKNESFKLKIARAFYFVVRSVYASAIFYFIPFAYYIFIHIYMLYHSEESILSAHKGN